ncbi:SAV_2336 N-terminal domain-related protein, partial [Streptomyces sp. NPDC005070]
MTEQQGEPSGNLTATEIAEAMWLTSIVRQRGGALDRPLGTTSHPADGSPDPSSDTEPNTPPGPRPVPDTGLPDTEADALPSTPQPAPEAVPERVAEVGRPRPSAHSADGAPVSASPSETRSIGRPALAGPLALARALRPLRTPSDQSRHRLFDEDATARQAAENDFWLPVFRPARSRPWSEATLIVDTSPTMRLWRRTCAEFTELLARIDAFASVRTLTLDTSVIDEPLTLRNRAHEVSPRALGAPGGASLVLVLTDGIGRAWREGSAAALVRDVARVHTTAVVNLLPDRAWQLTGIPARPVPLHRAASTPGNTGLLQLDEHSDDLYDDGLDDEEDLLEPLVPVLRLDPRFLNPWARLVAGRRTQRPFTLPVMLAPESLDSLHHLAAPASVSDPSDERFVRRARAQISPTAFSAAVKLASLPLSETILHELIPLLQPGFGPGDLGELLASGLLRAAPGNAAENSGLDFAFAPGVREHLLGFGSRADTYRTVERAHAIVTDQAQLETLAYQLRVFRGEDAALPAHIEGNTPYLQLSQTVIRALSGPPRVPAKRRPPSSISSVGHPDVAQRGGPVMEVSVAEARVPRELAVETSTLTTPSAGARRPSTVWYGVPPRNRYFTGRVSELAFLEARLKSDGPMASIDALIGMGAVGKSQLAFEYIYRHSHAHDVICWIPAEHPTQIVAAVQEIVHRLGIPLGSGDAIQSAVPALLEALRTGDLWQRWLLVFDNAENVEAVWPFLPLAGPGRVLVTSRNTQWVHVANTLELDVFSRQESVELLLRRNDRIGPRDADMLADALGDLPLALEQASAWLLETAMPVGEYLELFEERYSELLSVTPPQHYELSVAAAWNVALARLREDDPLALRILQFRCSGGTSVAGGAIARSGPVCTSC